MLGLPRTQPPAYGVLLNTATANLVLGVDALKPKGVAGATLSGDGSVVLVLDMEELFRESLAERRTELFALAA